MEYQMAKNKRIRNSCSVKTCVNPQNLRLHRLPRDPLLKELWTRACGLPNRPINSKISVCSLHFRPKDFLEVPQLGLNGSKSIRWLQHDAYPRICLPNEGYIQELECKIEYQMANLDINQNDYCSIRVTRTLLLKSTSTEAYNLLCNQGLIHPPPLSHQTKWMQNFSCKEGIQSDALDILGESVLAYNAPVDRLVVLCFRDIPSNKGVESPIGLTLGFARGLFQTWKQAVYFSQGFRTIKALMDEMRALIYEMEDRGLRVIALVFPPTERWTVALGLSSHSSFLPNPSNPKRTIFAFPDASTILQSIRKDILRNNLSFHGMRLSLKDLKEKIFIHLGLEHFDENKNGLSLAAEFISPCSAEAAIASSKKEMGMLIQALSDWLEVMNPSEEKPTIFGGDGLSAQTNTLSKLFNILPEISFSQESNVVMSLRISIQAMEALIISLREKYGVRSFSTERLSSEFIVGMVDPWYVQGELSPLVQEKFLRLQTLGPERGEIITEKDFIPSVKVFGALDVEIRLKPGRRRRRRRN